MEFEPDSPSPQLIDTAMSNQTAPTLYLMCGFIGSGKTGYSARIVAKERAICLTLDEWVNVLYGSRARYIKEFNPQERVKEVMWRTAQQALELEVSVVLDWGFWKYAEREKFRIKAKRLGAVCKVIWLDCTKDKCLERVKKRNQSLDQKSVHIDLTDFEEWWSLFEPPIEEDVERLIA